MRGDERPASSPFPAGNDEALDRFEILEELGSGAVGVVYRTYDRARRIEVALKTLRKLGGSALYRFKNEFRSLAGIVHENLVTLYELHSIGDSWFYTMELIDGVSFLEYVRPHEHLLPEVAEPRSADDATATVAPPAPSAEPPTTQTVTTFASSGSSGSAAAIRYRRAVQEGTLDVARLRHVLPQLARGVEALHRADRLHRDLKPSNVLVTPQGRVVLCDFGLVANVTGSEKPSEAKPRCSNRSPRPARLAAKYSNCSGRDRRARRCRWPRSVSCRSWAETTSWPPCAKRCKRAAADATWRC